MIQRRISWQRKHVLLHRVEITLTGPDDYPAEEGSYDEWLKEERNARYLFRAHLQESLREIKEALPDGYEIEEDSIR